MKILEALAKLLENGGRIQFGTTVVSRFTPSSGARVKSPYAVTTREGKFPVVFLPTEEEWLGDWIDPDYVAPPVIPITVEMTPTDHAAYLDWLASKQPVAETSDVI